MNRCITARTLFVTGSDTGVGKTVLTALLTAHLRSHQVPVFALKPFCSGGREDAELLGEIQGGELSLEQINPYYFSEPLAPLAAARKHHRQIAIPEVISHITQFQRQLMATADAVRQGTALRERPSRVRFTTAHSSLRHRASGERRNPVLLIEGVGGLLVPLAKDFYVVDLIAKLRCEVLVVARNRLGTINHCLLTVKTLRQYGLRSIKLALMETNIPDPSRLSNPGLLSELIRPINLFNLPFLRPDPSSAKSIQQHAVALRRLLAGILASS